VALLRLSRQFRSFTQLWATTLTDGTIRSTESAVRSIHLSTKEDNKAGNGTLARAETALAVLRTGNRSGANGSG
jgi:hypothetical protein